MNLNSIISMKAYQHSFEMLKSVECMPYAYIKGEALSIQAYGKIGQRNSSDIDILISRDNLHLFEKSLKSAGYSQTETSRYDKIMMLSNSHQVTPWIKDISPWGFITIDLNFDIFWGEHTGHRIDINDFLSDTIEMDIYGFNVKTLSPLKAMIQLILHHYKEMNSIYHLAGHNCINYNMFKDVYYLWKNIQDNNLLDKLYMMSEEYKIIPFVFNVLYFTNQIFTDLDFEDYLETFKTPEGVKLLDYYGLADKERKPWKVDFKTRLETENMYDLIKDDLTVDDIEKLERNRRIFGR